jgi:hypothetical protein
MTAGLPDAIREVILGRPAAFLHEMTAVRDQPEDLLVLVDKQHSLAPTYVPPDLVPVKDYPLTATWPGEEVVVVGYLLTRLRDLRGSYHLYQGFGGFIRSPSSLNT